VDVDPDSLMTGREGTQADVEFESRSSEPARPGRTLQSKAGPLRGWHRSIGRDVTGNEPHRTLG
jgi:hypothetical protein